MTFRLLILALLAAFFSGNLALAQTPKAPPEIHPAMGDVPMGNPKAPVKMIAYLSLSCPHCRDWQQYELPGFKKAYVDTGKVQLTFRDYPIDNRGVDVGLWSIARCAGPSEYYGIADELFRFQQAIQETDNPGPLLLDIARRHGLSEPQVYACFDSEALLATIQASHDEGIADFEAAGAPPATPGIFIAGKFVSDFSTKGMSAVADAALAAGKPN
ncbi:MAG TPA: thioredoxin domain-containing protein [Hyphomonadaceae bacterium]|nr:thioredoxin domain-containing protein [Hyphomonadaceae bacterium]